MLRLAFAGTPEFAVPALRALAASQHVLVGVLTQPDRPAGRGRELLASPIKRVAAALQLPLSQPFRLRAPADWEPLAQWRCDALIVVAYGLILPPPVLALPRLGCINVHASLLPRWRGAAPIQRAILAGDAQTGVSIMQLEAGLDTGPVFVQRPVPIGATSSAAQLQQTLAALGAQTLLETLDALAAARLTAQPQPSEGATYAPKIEKSEARIDWQHDAAAISRQVRAFNPWPVAETRWQAQQLRVWEAQDVAVDPEAPLNVMAPAVPVAASEARQDPAPGYVLGLDQGRLLVQCGRGVLAISRLQLAGRRTVEAAEFARGHSVAGMQFH
jgi:methionyl-tRNA formyltransferase